MTENLEVKVTKMEAELNTLRKFIKEQCKEKITLEEKVSISTAVKSKSFIFINILKRCVNKRKQLRI